MDAGNDYTKHMSQYSVISLSLKSMKQGSYELSYIQMKKMIAEEFRRLDFVLELNMLTKAEKERFQAIRDVNGTNADFLDALRLLLACMMQCTGKKTILLIDEYDVPLENAYFGGFYNEMIPLIRSFM